MEQAARAVFHMKFYLIHVCKNLLNISENEWFGEASKQAFEMNHSLIFYTCAVWSSSHWLHVAIYNEIN